MNLYVSPRRARSLSYFGTSSWIRWSRQGLVKASDSGHTCIRDMERPRKNPPLSGCCVFTPEVSPHSPSWVSVPGKSTQKPFRPALGSWPRPSALCQIPNTPAKAIPFSWHSVIFSARPKVTILVHSISLTPKQTACPPHSSVATPGFWLKRTESKESLA